MSERTSCPYCGALFYDKGVTWRHVEREHTTFGAFQQLEAAGEDFLRELGLFRIAGWLDRQLRRVGFG